MEIKMPQTFIDLQKYTITYTSVDEDGWVSFYDPHQRERWEWVPGFEGFYEVSNCGNIRSTDRLTWNSRGSKSIKQGQPMKGRADARGQGYLFWNTQHGNKYIHRAVAEAFIGPAIGDRNEVDHIDGDARNNHVNNLEWVTRAEQMRRAKERGVFNYTTNPNRANSHQGRKLTKDQVAAIQSDMMGGIVSKDICDKYGISHMHAQRIKQGRAHHNPSLTYPLGPTEPLSGRRLSERMGNRGVVGFRGVTIDHGRYRARIMVSGKSIAIGTYDTFDEAKQARLDAEATYWP
jgi:hypothetical protein